MDYEVLTINSRPFRSRLQCQTAKQHISKNKKFPENPPDIGDEWETINLNESDKKIYRNLK